MVWLQFKNFVVEYRRDESIGILLIMIERGCTKKILLASILI